MKRIISIICLMVMLLILSNVGYCNESYNVKYLGEKAISDMRFIPYITWSFVTMVGGRIVPPDGVVGDKDYNITIKGTNSNSNTTSYYGEFTGNLTKGINTLILPVKGKLGMATMKWQIQIELSDIVSEIPTTEIPTTVPLPTSAQPTISPVNALILNNPVTSSEALPQTGDEVPILIWLTGLCIVLFGSIWGYIRIKQIQKRP